VAPPRRPWFRFYVEAIHDRKLRRRSPSDRWLWIVLLAVARESSAPGVLLIGNKAAAIEDLADLAALKVREVKAGMDYFIAEGMVITDGSRLVVTDFEQYMGDVSPLGVGVRRLVIDRDGYVCGLCGKTVEPNDVHIDHIRPRARGGTDDVWNLQVAHSLCNMRKGARI